METEQEEFIVERLKEIKGLNPKSGLTYALHFFCEAAKVGIGLKKRVIKGRNNGVSPFIHGWSTFHRYAGIAKEFINFCKDVKKLNKLHKVQYGTVEDFLMRKIDLKDSESTLKVNMCALKKFFAICGRKDVVAAITEGYGGFVERARMGSPIRSFDNPQALIDKIREKDELAATIAEIQHLTGTRIHEVRSMWFEDTSIHIKGKGGKHRVLDFSYRQDKLERIKMLKDNLMELSKGVNWQAYCQKRHSTYQSCVRSACRSLQDEYRGAHGFRANYAQTLEKQLQEKGLNEEECEKTITRELGHERRSMARHYLSV